MNEWGNNNQIFGIIKLVEDEYANKFINEGSILFSNPSKWVTYYKEKGEGRGD